MIYMKCQEVFFPGGVKFGDETGKKTSQNELFINHFYFWQIVRPSTSEWDLHFV